jgi:hypothetical protein
VVAYWLGNPLLNPAELVFLALVAPWPWTVTRLVVAVVAGDAGHRWRRHGRRTARRRAAHRAVTAL